MAAGSSEGDIAVFSLPNLSKVMKVRGAHMIFVTDLAFSNDGKQIVSVSADAGARITTVTKESNAMYMLMLLIVLVIIVMYMRSQQQ